MKQPSLLETWFTRKEKDLDGYFYVSFKKKTLCDYPAKYFINTIQFCMEYFTKGIAYI